jgi:hypothetical protein
VVDRPGRAPRPADPRSTGAGFGSPRRPRNPGPSSVGGSGATTGRGTTRPGGLGTRGRSTSPRAPRDGVARCAGERASVSSRDGSGRRGSSRGRARGGEEGGAGTTVTAAATPTRPGRSTTPRGVSGDDPSSGARRTVGDADGRTSLTAHDYLGPVDVAARGWSQ